MELNGKFSTFKFKKTEKSFSLEVDGEIYYFSKRDSQLPSSIDEKVTVIVRGSFFSIKCNSELSAEDALKGMLSLSNKKEQ